jgi:hypothetical protein
MNSSVKIGLYVVLIIVGAFLGRNFYHAKQDVDRRAVDLADPSSTGRTNKSTNSRGAVAHPAPTNAAPKAITHAPDTNAPAAPTNATAIPADGEPISAVTNAATTNHPPAVVTNAATAATNTPAPTTNVAVTAAEKNAEAANADGTAAAGSLGAGHFDRGAAYGRMIAYFGGFVLVAIILGLMVAHDISHYFGSRTVDFLFTDAGMETKAPEYEQAEQLWANGDPLGAIQMLRDYYISHPRELFVPLRIAEIYEKDLNNNLAAALEYEQILQNKFERQRWAWAAIHLCNLYFKLNKNPEAVALLHRIHEEYGDTPAAEKARKRLVQIDPDFNPITEIIASPVVEIAEEPSPAPPEEPPSNLPPGFRPRKK